MPNSLKFGTSGLRGLATELIGAESRRYAAAFVRFVREQGGAPTMLIGRDLRASSPAISQSVIEAVTALGMEAVDCGEVPTPALALESARVALPAIMVTGSHIPADRNGLKFYFRGEIDKAAEDRILALLDEAPSGQNRARFSDEASHYYRDRFSAMLPPGVFKGRRIGVWQHSSVMREMLNDMLEHFGAEVVALGRSASFIAVDTEAVAAETAAMLTGWVQDHRLDALVSTDGDADRPLVVDEAGALMRGDLIGILTAKFLGAHIAVTPVTSNSSIESTGFFETVIRTKVGSPYVIEGMAKASMAAGGPRTIVGFEANGGVLLGSDVEINGARLTALPTRDAMLPILAVLGAAKLARSTLSELAATLPPRFARSDRLENVPAAKSAQLLSRLDTDAAAFFAEQGGVASMSNIDGLRYELSSGEIIHFRPSGNAPELRCYTEAASTERAAQLLAWALAAARAVLH